MNKPKKYIAYFILAFCIFFLFVSTLGIIIVNLYGDDIKNYAINSLNKELAVKVEIAEMDISVFRQFPHISIVFENVVAYSSNQLNHLDFPDIQSDTLFHAALIFLRFNSIDILFGNYKMKSILAQNGKLTLLIDKKGNINYKLLKTDKSESESDLSIDLELFKLNNFHFEFINIPKDIHASGKKEEIILKGKFGNKKFNMLLSGSLFLESFNRKGIKWADKIKIESRILMDASDSVYVIRKGSININDLKFETGGSIITGNQIDTDLIIEGENLGIRSVINILPENINKTIREYSPDGKAVIRVSVKGQFSSLDIPSINAEYSITKGKLKLPGQPDFSGISFIGSYSNGLMHIPATSSFSFNGISAKTGKSTVMGNVYIENLISPYIKADFTGDIFSPDINHFYKDSLVSFTKGMIYPDLKVSTKLSSFNDFDIRKIITTSLSGNLTVNNTGILFSNDYPEIKSLEGKVSISNDIWVSQFEVETTSGDITFEGRLDHVLKRFIHNTSSLWVQGNVYSNHTDLSFLLKPGKTSTTSESFLLPDKLFMKLDAELKSFVMGKFNAIQVSATLSYKPGFLNVSSLSLNTMKGTLSGYGGLIQDAGGSLMMKTSTSLSKLDINELFDTFNNFSQDFITSSNLAGRISGLVEISTTLQDNLIPETKETWAEASIIIENGELKDFEPLKNLSKFIEVSELEHVRFQTLQNTFIIKDSKVFLPEMDIRSSAFNISASGEHGFNNYFDYKLKVNLSELLSKKARTKKENNEFAVLEKDGERINLFLHIWGSPDDFKIRYDRREAVQQIRRDIVNEKKELKTILNEELGLFRKQFTDSTLKEGKETPPLKFIMEWGEEDESDDDSSSLKRKVKESEKKNNVLKFDWD